jgi:hypothetical protein
LERREGEGESFAAVSQGHSILRTTGTTEMALVAKDASCSTVLSTNIYFLYISRFLGVIADMQKIAFLLV